MKPSELTTAEAVLGWALDADPLTCADEEDTAEYLAECVRLRRVLEEGLLKAICSCSEPFWVDRSDLCAAIKGSK